MVSDKFDTANFENKGHFEIQFLDQFDGQFLDQLRVPQKGHLGPETAMSN